jgi:hypothetical protein
MEIPPLSVRRTLPIFKLSAAGLGITPVPSWTREIIGARQRQPRDRSLK